MPFGAALGFSASGLHQGSQRRDGGWLCSTAKSHLPLRNQPAVNCKCNPDQKKKKNQIPSLPIPRAASFTLGHTASHPVCPQRGRGSRVGCSRTYLPCTSLLHLSGSLALCGEGISISCSNEEQSTETKFIAPSHFLPGKGLMLLGQNTDLDVFSELLCIFPVHKSLLSNCSLLSVCWQLLPTAGEQKENLSLFVI